MKLDIGAGNSSDQNFIKMDIYNFGNINVVHDMEEIPYPFESESIEEIRANHSLEHCSHNSIQDILNECYRLLKKDGIIRIEVPCLESSIKRFLLVPDEEKWASVEMEYIFGNQGRSQIGNQYHKCGFTLKTLQKLVENAKFVVEEVYRYTNTLQIECIILRAKK